MKSEGFLEGEGIRSTRERKGQFKDYSQSL